MNRVEQPISERVYDEFRFALAEACKKICEKTFRTIGGMPNAMLVILTRTSVGMVPVPMGITDPEECDAIVDAIRHKLKAEGAVGYGLCIEALARAGTEEQIAGSSLRELPPQPSLVIVGQTPEETFARLFLIERDPDGGFIGLGEDMIPPSARPPDVLGFGADLLYPTTKH